jgi:hypothetical protein
MQGKESGLAQKGEPPRSLNQFSTSCHLSLSLSKQAAQRTAEGGWIGAWQPFTHCLSGFMVDMA